MSSNDGIAAAERERDGMENGKKSIIPAESPIYDTSVYTIFSDLSLMKHY